MPAEPISLTAYRQQRSLAARQTEQLPLVLNVHVGAVELIIGGAFDDDAPELWLSPEQAIALADDLRRTALAAKAKVPR